MQCRRYNNCQCHNEFKEEMIEKSCAQISYETKDDCSCGFDNNDLSVFPENPMLAQSYVPIQYMNKTFIPEVGLRMGTLFPELVSPYYPGQSMQEIAYIRATNQIGEGCNR